VPDRRTRIAAALALAAAAATGCAQLGIGGTKEDARPPQTGIQAILARGELRIGMSGEQPPLTMTTKKGELVGLDVALGRVLAQVIGVKAVFVRMPFAELLDAVVAHDIDLAMSGIGITPERNLRVAFVGPYLVSGKSLLSKKDEILAVKDPAELDRAGITIVALAGSTSEDYVRRNLPKAALVTTPGLDAAVEMVITDRADALLADLETCHFAALRHQDAGLRTLGRTFTTEPMGIAVAPDDAQLINLLENYLKALERQGALEKANRYWFENDDWLGALR
jgi:polar amino acid transport system substrate-binding protein